MGGEVPRLRHATKETEEGQLKEGIKLFFEYVLVLGLLFLYANCGYRLWVWWLR